MVVASAAAAAAAAAVFSFFRRVKRCRVCAQSFDYLLLKPPPQNPFRRPCSRLHVVYHENWKQPSRMLHICQIPPFHAHFFFTWALELGRGLSNAALELQTSCLFRQQAWKLRRLEHAPLKDRQTLTNLGAFGNVTQTLTAPVRAESLRPNWERNEKQGCPCPESSVPCHLFIHVKVSNTANLHQDR